MIADDKCARCGHARIMHHASRGVCNNSGFHMRPCDCKQFEERAGTEVKAEEMRAQNPAQVDDMAGQIVEVCKMWGFEQRFALAVMRRAAEMVDHAQTWKNPLEGTGLKVSPNGPAIEQFTFSKGQGKA